MMYQEVELDLLPPNLRNSNLEARTYFQWEFQFLFPKIWSSGFLDRIASNQRVRVLNYDKFMDMSERKWCITCDGRWCTNHECPNSYLVFFNPFDRDDEADEVEDPELQKEKDFEVFKENLGQDFVCQMADEKIEHEVENKFTEELLLAVDQNTDDAYNAETKKIKEVQQMQKITRQISCQSCVEVESGKNPNNCSDDGKSVTSLVISLELEVCMLYRNVCGLSRYRMVSKHEKKSFFTWWSDFSLLRVNDEEGIGAVVKRRDLCKIERLGCGYNIVIQTRTSKLVLSVSFRLCFDPGGQDLSNEGELEKSEKKGKGGHGANFEGNGDYGDLNEKGLLLGRSAKEKKAYKKHLSKGCCLVPGSVNGSWSDIEERPFLLGLYIFRKDLVLVKKSVKDKLMEGIHSYYYGKSYGSNEYRRWSECRNVRNKKCVNGHKLFSGMRQQQLLSRLFSLVLEELQSSLSEASKNDGKLIVSKYVFALKALVGTENFVDTMAIGNGEIGLSLASMKPQRVTQVAPPRSKLLTAKACSSLTPQEITKSLTGGCRLSEAKSNDLSMWLCLLAKGWHSEQPDGQIYSFGTKGSSVCLTPCVKKFSRRNLVMGNHYLDCNAVVKKIIYCITKIYYVTRRLQFDPGGDGCAGSDEARYGLLNWGSIPNPSRALTRASS